MGWLGVALVIACLIVITIPLKTVSRRSPKAIAEA
jgi:DME family drug/metabolite transporter